MEADSIEIKDELIAAMENFKTLAKQLIDKLIAETDQPGKLEIAKGHYYEIENADTINGQENLSDNWWFDVHGEHCLFKNLITGQTLEVSLGNEESIGNLDPSFFYHFLETTAEFKHLPPHLGHPFKGTLKMFTELEKQNLLKHIYGVEYRRI